MKNNNSVKISTLFTKLNQHRINPQFEQDIETLKGNTIHFDRSALLSQSLYKNDLAKAKQDSISEEKFNSLFGVQKQQIFKSLNLQGGRLRLNSQESSMGVQATGTEQSTNYKSKQGDGRKQPIYEHQRLLMEKKCLSMCSIKPDSNSLNNKTAGHSDSQKILILQQDQSTKTETIPTDSLVFSIDKGFNIKGLKSRADQNRQKKYQNSNERVQSLPNDRMVTSSLNIQASQSPTQQNNENTFKSIMNTKPSSTLTKPNLAKNYSGNTKSLLSTIYFNQNPYQLNHSTQQTESNKVSTKNSTSTQLISQANESLQKQKRHNRKNLTEYQSQNNTDQGLHQENLSLYLLYREQQREQDKKLREISNNLRSIRNSQVIQKQNGNTILDCLQGNSRIVKTEQEAQENSYLPKQISKQDFFIAQKQSLFQIQKAISQPNFGNQDKNSTEYSFEKEQQRSCNNNQDMSEYERRRQSSFDNILKTSRSQSLQTLLVQKNNKSIQYETGEVICDDVYEDEDEAINNSIQNKQINEKEDDNDDEEEEQQYPSPQTKMRQKKTTQNATMQTTFTETMPEIIAKELDFVHKHNSTLNISQKNNLKKKERLVSYFSVNDKKFKSTTSDYMKKYENDPKSQKYPQQINNKQYLDTKYVNENNDQLQLHHQSVKSLHQDNKNSNNQTFDMDTPFPLNEIREITLPITAYTSKEEFLSQLNKRIQKVQQNNILFEKKRIQEGIQSQQYRLNNSVQFDEANSLTSTFSSNFSVGKRIVFCLESEDTLKKIKESNNPSLYELLKSYQLNGSLYSQNNFKESEQIFLYPHSELPQTLKTINARYAYSKGKIVCNIVLKKSRNKTSLHYDINNILSSTSNAYKSQLLSQSILNK